MYFKIPHIHIHLAFYLFYLQKNSVLWYQKIKFIASLAALRYNQCYIFRIFFCVKLKYAGDDCHGYWMIGNWETLRILLHPLSLLCTSLNNLSLVSLTLPLRPGQCCIKLGFPNFSMPRSPKQL